MLLRLSKLHSWNERQSCQQRQLFEIGQKSLSIAAHMRDLSKNMRTFLDA